MELKLDNTRLELEAKNSSLESLTRSHLASSEELEENRSALKLLQTQLDNRNKELTAVTADFEASSETVKLLRSRAEEADSQNRAEVELLGKELGTVQQLSRDQLAEISSLKDQLENLGNTLSKKEAEIETMVVDNKEMIDLKDQVRQAVENLKSSNSELEAIQVTSYLQLCFHKG